MRDVRQVGDGPCFEVFLNLWGDSISLAFGLGLHGSRERVHLDWPHIVRDITGGRRKRDLFRLRYATTLYSTEVRSQFGWGIYFCG